MAADNTRPGGTAAAMGAEVVLEHDTTVQALLAEALALLFIARDKMPIAGSDRK